jgi:OOP family OmpA-OmpF porin
LIIEISGHTDNIGSAEYNYTLSKNRAKSVYEALVLFGVKEKQLSYQGYGFDFPLNNDETQEGRLENRRTEIKVIGSDYGK